jgi:hypothetical protein
MLNFLSLLLNAVSLTTPRIIFCLLYASFQTDEGMWQHMLGRPADPSSYRAKVLITACVFR